jgi:hypothetical protein
MGLAMTRPEPVLAFAPREAATPELPAKTGISPAPRPGFDARRMVSLMRAAIRRCGLDLSGLTVVTEAATGAYASTAVIAALAGAAKVYARTADSPHGSAAAAAAEVLVLARCAGVAGRIDFFSDVPRTVAGRADIITNSGHLRPLDAALIDALPETAVIALMYEAWEFREADIDLAACRRKGIPVVGVNERHPSLDVFAFLGPLAANLLHRAGIPVYRSRIVLLCDNPFDVFIWRGLKGLGADVSLRTRVEDLPADGEMDAVLVAMRPTPQPALSVREAAFIAENLPGAVVAQFWGDVDREALRARSVPVWPEVPPKPGHMGVLLSDIGPEPIIRLQTGSLRAAELIYRSGRRAGGPGGIADPLPATADCLK